ncbi:TPR repeat-containing protein [Cavenderia fasciculata]|uniref:TPR repeat-containing protein n=1 Tax=Cavenderia fasciculata TaxID=261658 RepID=F4PJ97_CACFS|nr:TPR repeat-containing protein [Cavenderia fasciculata]EGG24383.1 TPR repeat-containing protein [Cavenderia fasciculata]|eukprot:XP_004362234.1 TPR repeat-containing protein [Cavenderia fasciculata]
MHFASSKLPLSLLISLVINIEIHRVMEDINKGNSFFVDEEYDKALECYDRACKTDPQSYEAHFKRSQCHHNLNSFNDAIADVNTCIKIDPNNPKAYLKKGQYLFELEEYESALASFEKGQSLDAENSQFKTWVRKTKAELGQSATPTPAAVPTPAPVAVAPVAAKPEQPKLPLPSVGTKVRHEWFDTATNVTVTIFAKFVTASNSKIEIKDKSLSVSFLMATGSEYLFECDLFDPIIVAESTVKYSSMKVEILLKKSRAIKWDDLEYTGATTVSEIDQSTATNTTASTTTGQAPSVVSPYASKKNWDDIDAEDKEGDPLNRVFQDIFSRGSEEQRRAMMKSFVESGGTVLSTNWEDVGQKKVKGAPPKGMEMRGWGNGEIVKDLKKEDEDCSFQTPFY